MLYFSIMNLTIDIGNTSSKAMLFDKDNIKWTRSYKNITAADLKQLFSKHKVDNSILSAVVPVEKNIFHFLRSHSSFILLNSKVKLPIRNKYKTPETLGSDRLASVAGASKLFPRKNCLVIDAGTCIKYDFINSKKEYLGGSISPGLRMRFKALHNFTGGLPLIEPSKTEQLIGSSTRNSILTGVQNGIVNEINGFIQRYKKQFGSLKVILSGGDASFFAGHIKNSIFAAPDLIHIGLHEILIYNVEQS